MPPIYFHLIMPLIADFTHHFHHYRRWDELLSCIIYFERRNILLMMRLTLASRAAERRCHNRRPMAA